MPGIKLTPIKPKNTVANLRKILPAIEAATRTAAGELLKDHEKTTATWTHKPRWIARVGRDGVEVRTDSEIWKFVDEGTRPHVIRPRRGRWLRFQGGYQAKTRPGSIIARGGGASGPTIYAQQVNHPGTKARGFSRRLRAKWKAKYPKMVQNAIREALK